MNIRTTLAFAVLFFVGFGTLTQAQNLKIGVVNYEKIVEELPETKEVRLQLEAFEKSLQDTLNMYQQTLTTEVEAFQAQQDMMTAEGKKQKQEELQNQQQQLVMFRQSANMRLQQKQRELLQPILQKIEAAIAKLAKEEGLDLVLNSGGASSMVLHAAEKIDYTFRVIDGLKRQ